MAPSSLDKKVTNYIIQAQEEEIKRISNELHEGVSQTLYSLFTGLQFVEKQQADPKIKQIVSEMVQLTERTIEELRWVSTELYPASLDTLGIVAAIRSYLKVYTSTFGIDVEVKTMGTERVLSSEQKIALFRSCQEALVNSAKYADTSKVFIDMKWEDNKIMIIIKDEGVGFSIEEVTRNQECLGLASIKQRLELLSGTATVHSTPGKGTIVTLVLPI
ncbi:hypothetical protein GCM10008967_14180 [Bacillus carboniphilus]|uniref:Oxygen sensor histidine kinase NreB n=1 Tax=Bacillus carboniphilus TaxID=86663 RepID=A0ABN0W4C9_9BACI